MNIAFFAKTSYATVPITEVGPFFKVKVVGLIEVGAIGSLNVADTAVATGTLMEPLVGLVGVTVGGVVSLPIYVIVIVPAFADDPATTVIPVFSALQFTPPPETVPSSLIQ
jgi:hypothetical protein